MKTNILAIESSCDDTAAAVISEGQVLSNVVATQETHRLYGGVVPELASRAHQENIIPVVHQALSQANISPNDINAVAFTRGPGLMGSLLVGVSFAKAFALSREIPLVEVNHMQAHVLAHFAEKPHPRMPFICLTVSGGHTQLVYVKDHLDMEIVGTTLDDAAGEAFDKTGKLLGLPYPAGPEIDKLAQKGHPVFEFPEPEIAGLDFSFSGLKTAILYFLREKKAADPDFIEKNLSDICASVQDRIVSILMSKLHRAVDQYKINDVAIAGGVSANSALRKALLDYSDNQGWNPHIPKFEYCTDNAAMIGVAGYYKYLENQFSSQDITPFARSGKELN